MKPSILIYRDRLLYPSETFIRDQAESMKSFSPYYLGARPIEGLKTPSERTLFIGGSDVVGRINEILFKGLHFAPFTMHRVKKLNPSLVHAHFGIDAVEAMPIAARLRVPLVVTFHGHDVTMSDEYARLNRRGRRYLRHRCRLSQFSNLNIAVSNYLARELVSREIVRDDILVHYIGVDVNRFTPDPSSKRESIVLFVGRLAEVKGCEYVIRAMGAVGSQCPGSKLVIIGDGPLRRPLEELSKAQNCLCEFLGIQPPDIVRHWMNRARVLCAPSVTASNGSVEAFGLAAIEAQSMGLPVVSSMTGGIPEAVQGGVTGLLAPERDWRTLASHLHTLLTDDAIWQRFSVAGRERVCREFNLERQTRILETKYEELLDRWHLLGARSMSSDVRKRAELWAQ